MRLRLAAQTSCKRFKTVNIFVVIPTVAEESLKMI